MTEIEYFACMDVQQLLNVFGRSASRRKLRLFACGCCREVWPRINQLELKKLVELVERYADGKGMWREVLAARDKVVMRSGSLHDLNLFVLARDLCSHLTNHAASRTAATAAFIEVVTFTGSSLWINSRDLHMAHFAPDAVAAANSAFSAFAHQAAVARQVFLFHDLFGNPFRSFSMDSSWLAHDGGAVVKLAHHIYQERDFASMDILADALEEACCPDSAILDHLRDSGPHARGCWVLDAIFDASRAIGKSW